MGQYSWSEEENELFLLGDLSGLDSQQLALRLDLLRDRQMLNAVTRRLSGQWKTSPETVLLAWELLNERKDWEGREAALTLVKGLDETFLQGRVGERRRARLKELLDDQDSDVVNAAKAACAGIGIKNERTEP
jgi:hypothetical protein